MRGDHVVRRALARDSRDQPAALVAIGKAACAMAAGARQSVGRNLHSGLIITRHGYETGFDIGDLPVLTAGHPLPDAASLRAGQRLLDFLAGIPHGCEVLFLLSGGASSLVEVLPPGVSLADLVHANEWLLASGLDIHQINRVRASLSAIKAGRLAGRLEGRPARALLMSDVPDDRPASIGSGLLVPPDGDSALPRGLPTWLANLAAAAPPAPRRTDPLWDGIVARVVAGNRDALDAAAARAQGLGFTAIIHDAPLVGPTETAHQQIARRIGVSPTRPSGNEASVCLWGGETTPVLPPEPGRGGRSQHLALALARTIAGRRDICVLCAGTDGSDGPGDDAGALVDGGTIDRGRLEGLDEARCYATADSGRFLEASGDLLSTGPTGTNVMDMVIAVAAGFPSRLRASTLAPEPGEAF